MLREDRLSLRQKYLSVLKSLAPAGAVGVSLILGAAGPAAASEEPVRKQPSALENEMVSERLAAVREAISDIGKQQTDPDSVGRVTWWWGNGGWGWPNWPNWRNWGNWWHNW